MTEKALAGGCLCGGVRFRIHRPVRDVWVCHCSQCRRTSGHYWATTAVALERFELTESKTLRWFRSSEKAVAVFAIPAVQACFGTETTVNR